MNYSKRTLANYLLVISVLLILLGVFYFAVIDTSTDQTPITVSGAWALYPMMLIWIEEYQKINPSIRIEVSAGGTGKGVADALSGLADIGMASREITPNEIERGAVSIAVAKDAVIPIMNDQNPYKELIQTQGLTQQDFKKLWIDGSRTRWADLLQKNDSAIITREKGTFTESVNVYTRSDSAGAADAWAKYLGAEFAQEDLQGIGVYGDPGLAAAVKADIYGVAFSNLNFVYDIGTGNSLSGILVIPIDIDGDGAIASSENFYLSHNTLTTAIRENHFPSPPARQLYLLSKGKFSEEAQEFITWILTDGQRFVEEAGYVKLDPPVVQQELSKIGEQNAR